MIFRLLAPAALVLSLLADQVCAAPASDGLARHAEFVSKLIGMSPEGTRLWAEHALANSNFGEWAKSTSLDQALGEQVSLAQPDPQMLDRLANENAAELGRLARLRQASLLKIAFRLSPTDRRTLGAFIVMGADEALKRARPFPGATEFVSAWIRSMGVSEEGTRRLVEQENLNAPAEAGYAKAKIKRSIGEQLTQEDPDPAVLDELVTAFAAEESRAARLEKENLISAALEMSPNDRRAIGSFLAEQAAKSLGEAKPVLEVLP